MNNYIKAITIGFLIGLIFVILYMFQYLLIMQRNLNEISQLRVVDEQIEKLETICGGTLLSVEVGEGYRKAECI